MTDSPTRVLHVFGQMERGGAELRTIDVIRSCGHGEFEFHFCILSGKAGSLDATIRDLGGRLHKCRLGPTFPVRFVRLLRKEQIDVVHSHVHYVSGMMVALAALAGVPVRIVHFRTSSDGARQWLPRLARDRVLKALIWRYATQILSVSRSALDHALGPLWQADPRCGVVYNGVPAPREPMDAGWVRELLGLSGNEPLIVHIGSMRPEKNHPKLISTFKSILDLEPDAHLALVGRGTSGQVARLKSEASRVGVTERIHYAGEQEEVSLWLNAAALMVFPSFSEGLPGAVLEALAHGVPVLASDLPVHLELQPHFAHLRIAGLQESSESWGRLAVDLLTFAPPGSPEREGFVRSFDRTPFKLANAVRSLQAAWTGSSSGAPI